MRTDDPYYLYVNDYYLYHQKLVVTRTYQIQNIDQKSETKNSPFVDVVLSMVHKHFHLYFCLLYPLDHYHHCLFEIHHLIPTVPTK
jgi:hypothetical protein